MFEGKPITFNVIEVPSDAPLFLLLIAIHVLAALVCVISGIFAMAAKKEKGVHTRAGRIYFSFLWSVFLTATIIAIVRWKHDYYLFILGVASFATAFIGRKAILKKWKKWIVIHISCMASSYIFLIIAFYVDNGRFLPFWKMLDPVWYWALPPIVGIPLTVWTLLTNRLSRDYFRKNNH